jgi:tRNA-modifying protein YgfZ
MGEPRLGVDIGEDTIPEEAGLVEGAVDFDKGCYLGQELVARIDSRGHVNRYLRGLLMEEPAAAAAPVATRTGDVGWVTSAAVSADLGPIALAMVRREVEVGDRVIVAGAVPATVTDLPMSEG